MRHCNKWLSDKIRKSLETASNQSKLQVAKIQNHKPLSSLSNTTLRRLYDMVEHRKIRE